MNIVVAGTGYVGLVTGVCLAHIGHNVICVDVDEKKIGILKEGISPIYEEGLESLIKENYANGRLIFTTDYKKYYSNADIIFIGVGTPERFDGSPDLRYVFKAAKQIAETIEKDCLIVLKSTVPIGTNDDIEKYIKENIKKHIKVEVVSNPEFLSQGTAVKDTLQASRIVIGVESKEAEQILRNVYEPFNQPIVVTNRKSAEMVKYASNDFLALKVSFINEIANLCEIVGANVEEVTKGMSYDPRIGDKFLKAGIGYGGSCFPKDTKALHWLAEDNGYEIKTVKATIEVNENQKFRLMKKAKKKIKSFEGLKVAVLGLTFKPGTDDLREAPSIPNVKMLIEEGANIFAYDPIGIKNYKKIFKESECFCNSEAFDMVATTAENKQSGHMIYVNNPEDALKGADVAFIFTEWQEIKMLPLSIYKELMKNPIIFDGRNCYSIEEARTENVQYFSIGRQDVV
jgi:UDPglucose 6-dehydrogenase